MALHLKRHRLAFDEHERPVFHQETQRNRSSWSGAPSTNRADNSRRFFVWLTDLDVSKIPALHFQIVQTLMNTFARDLTKIGPFLSDIRYGEDEVENLWPSN